MRDYLTIRRLQEFLALCRYVEKRFAEDDCLQYAKALTYMSLFALVPMMTVVVGPNVNTMTMAKRMAGIDRMASSIRLMISSTQPRK